MPKACAEGGLSVHGPTPCGARRFRAGMDGSVGRSLENPWSLSGGALSLRPSFFRFFRLSNKGIRGDVVYWIVFQAFPCGRNAKVSCIPERAVKISLQRILEGFSNLGFLGSPPPYRMPSRTPFADDRRKLRMDSRRFLDALGRNAGVLKRGRKADDRAASE